MVQGWPDRKHEIPQNLATYWNIRHELSEAEGLIFKDHQLVIPTAMRSNMLNLIHESHLGIKKCKARARAILFGLECQKISTRKYQNVLLAPHIEEETRRNR